MKIMKIRILCLLLLISTTAFGQSTTLRVKGFGELPVSKKGDSYVVTLGSYGEFALKGDLKSKELSGSIQLGQLSKFPGFMVLSKLGLSKINLKVSEEGVLIHSMADTKGSLEKLCKLFKITSPQIEVSVLVSKGSAQLSAALDFVRGPVQFMSIKETGTSVKFTGASIATKLEPGTALLSVTSNLLIKPTKFDPDLESIYTFSYDLVSQTLSGSGSMMSVWKNPLGSSQFLKKDAIVFSNAAVEMGINMATLVPVNLGLAMEKGKIFTLDFGVVVSIDPVGKEVAFIAKRDKMNVNDFTTFLREGFGLSIPNVLPDIYYIDQPYVLFAPNGGSVGEVEIEKGLALKGKVKVGDAIEGPIDFSFDMENEFKLKMDLNYDYRKFIMNEVRKIKPLAPLANKILSTFQIRKLSIDMHANKDDMHLSGKTHCKFEVFGSAHEISFAATLDPQQIAKNIVGEISKLAGPEIAAMTKIVGNAFNQSKNIAAKGFNDARKLVGTASRHVHSQGTCNNKCVPDLARKMYTPILNGGNQAMQSFHDGVINVLVGITGENDTKTKAMRADLIRGKWNELTRKIDQDWETIRQDRTYVAFYIMPSSATNGGHIYRRKIDEKKGVYEALKKKLWVSMLNANPQPRYVKVQNRWKSTYINLEKGLAASAISPGWQSAMWIIEPVAGTKYVMIKNRWKGTYLNVEHGFASTKILPGWHSAMWELEPVAGTNYVRIKNRWKGTYINVERGLGCTTIAPGWLSAMWMIK